MTRCDAFIALATRGYGESAGDPAATGKQLTFWETAMMKKGTANALLPVRMIPWGEEYLHVSATVLFNSNELVLTWVKGDPMPATLVRDTLQALIALGRPLQDLL